MARLLVYSGKGGAGTTTCSAATARRFAADGRETAIVSIDPMQSLSGILDVDVGPEPTRVRSGLTAVEINPGAGQETYQGLFDAVAGTASVAGLDLDDGHVARFVSDTRLPFGREFAALEAVVSFVGDGEYDVVVFDTGLQGRVLKLIQTPGLLGQGLDAASMVTDEVGSRVGRATDAVLGPVPWMGSEPGAVRESTAAGGETGGPRPPGVGPATETGTEPADAEAIEARVNTVRSVLRGGGSRELRLVTTPDRVESWWTDHMVVNLRNAGIPAGPLVVNKVVEDGSCCARCTAKEQAHRETVEGLRDREELDVVVLPDLHGRAGGEAMLERMADRLVA